MNSKSDAKYEMFDLDSAFDFNPISFDSSTDFLGGANYTYSDASPTQGFDGTFYSFVEGEPCPLDPEPAVQEVEIDIKPGSDPNSINLCSNGGVPVAILGSASFDVVHPTTGVDPDSITLADAQVRTVGKGNKLMCNEDDVNSDGFTDLVCQIPTVDLAVEPGVTNTTADLNALTFDGVIVEGSDSMQIVKECL